MELYKEDFHKNYDGYWYNLIVPINEKGACEILVEPVESVVTENMDYLLLVQTELDTLMPLFNIFNETFGILIDAAENEILEYENLEKAKEIAIKYMEKTEEQNKSVLNKLITMLNKALEYHTFLWIYL